MSRLRVAICTHRPPAVAAGCLDELRAQGLPGADLLVVASGLDGPGVAAHELAVHAATPDATVLSETRPGLSRARNAALAACADEDLIAFVDDDCLPAPGWLSALRSSWDDAAADLAAVGGPIRLRFPYARPPWLTDEMLGALTALDYGPDPLELDPSVRTLHGTNISFRSGPLREAGGFDPSYGHSGTRIFFGEEGEAQRALARLGYRIRYEPSVWVWHLVPAVRLTRRKVLSRRFYYGASLGRRGGRSSGAALRAAARSAAGVPVALLGADQSLAMERAYRAVENTGVVLWRAVRAADDGATSERS